MQHQGAGRLAFAGAGRRIAQPAGVGAGIFVHFADEMATALRTLGAREHTGIHELHEAPCAGEGQQGFDLGRGDLLAVEPVGLGEQFHGVQAHALGQIFVDVQEQGTVDVLLPGEEPVGGERQLALGRRLARDLLVEPDQPLVRQGSLRLQHLHAGAHLDQHGGALDLLGFVQDALHGGGSCGHGGLSEAEGAGRSDCGGKAQSTSDTRLAMRMLACSVLVASLPTFLGVLWLVSRLQTRLSSTRKLHSRVLREASLSTWAAEREARMSAASSLMPRRNTASALSWRISVWASIR